MAEIRLQSLAHSYASQPKGPEDYAILAMDHVWEQGGAYALLGPSGCGKSTLLNIISGLLSPSEGQVLFDTREVNLLPPEERNIAQVFQFPVVYDTMTVFDNLAFPLRNQGLPESRVLSKVSEIAEVLDLHHLLKRKARNLTADEKQKVSMGRGLVRDDVSAILFDEPLTVIDPHMKWELRTQLKSLHRDFGHTMIYVTHDQTEALTFADKVVVMYDGRVVQIGTPEELFDRPEHTFVGYFIGSPGMNLLPATVEGSQAQVPGGATALAGSYGALSGKVQLGIRPEHVRLSADQGLPVTIRRIEDVGRHRIIRADLMGHDLNIIAPEDQAITADMTRAVFDPGRVNIYADDWRVAAA